MTIFERRVVAGADDVEQHASGAVSKSSSDLELGADGSNPQHVGLRFTEIAIPPGAKIIKAYIQFRADEVSTASASLLVYGQDSDDAAPFSRSNNVSARPATDVVVPWSVSAWTQSDEAGLLQRSPDLSAVLQEIVDRDGWSAGNDMAFVITGTGSRTADAFEGGFAPVLHVEYTLSTDEGARPVVDLDGSADGLGYATVFEENRGGVPISDLDIVLTDPDSSDLEGATVTLQDAEADDELIFDHALLPSGVSLLSTATSLVFTGTASLASYQAAIRQVLFNNSGETPGAVPREISVTIDDGSMISATATSTIAIDSAPDAADDDFTTTINSPVSGDVLTNDDQGDTPASIAAMDSVSAQGGVIINGSDGSFAYTPAANFVGADRFNYTISDANGDSSTATVNVTVGISAPQIFERRVSSGADDVEEQPSGSVSKSSSDLELGVDGAKPQHIGLRFTAIDIPAGATITNAYIQFRADEVSTSPTSLLIRGHDGEDADPFSSANNVSTRLTTDAAVQWEVPAWTTPDQVDLAQRTPDLSSVLQEMVDQDGWGGGNDISFVITGTGTRTADAYDGDASFAPLLHVEWSLGPSDTIAPEVTIDSPLEGTVVSGTIELSAIASDDQGISSVQFRVDSENIGEPDTTSPYVLLWNSGQESDGTVALSAVAEDLHGNVTVSLPVTVSIMNGVEPPPPPPPPASGTLRVPEDYSSIQAAIDAAGDGDTVLVGPGVYEGGIIIGGKSITLASHYASTGDGSIIESTIIAGGEPAISVSASAPDTTIEGFHFTGGVKSIVLFAPGGQVLNNFFDDTGSDAVSLENVGGLVRGNHFFSPGDDGVDVDAASGDVIIENNIFQLAGDDGIEIRNQNYSGPHVTLFIRNNEISGSDEDGIQIIDYNELSNRSFVIEGNLIRTSAAAGLGLMDNGETIEDLRGASMPERIYVFNNTLDANRVAISGGDNLIAVNNIVSNSTETGIKNSDSGSIVAFTLFHQNATDQLASNIDSSTLINGDPLYTSTFGLQADSPAIDAGTASYVYNGETVLVIEPSRYDGQNPDLGWLV